MEAFPPRATRSAPDLVVVGASFAGAACAIAAAQRGLHVVVLERKRDPGAKLRTTGIIVKEAAEATLLGQLPAALGAACRALIDLVNLARELRQGCANLRVTL